MKVFQVLLVGQKAHILNTILILKVLNQQELDLGFWVLFYQVANWSPMITMIPSGHFRFYLVLSLYKYRPFTICQLVSNTFFKRSYHATKG